MGASGKRLLRPLVDTDLPLIFELQRDPEAVAMARVPARDREAFDANWETIRADAATTVRVVDDGAGGVAGGSWPSRARASCAWATGSRASTGAAGWRRGRCATFLDELPARPLHATVATDNVASRRVLEKCGFAHLGTTTEWDDRLGEDVAIHRFELR